MIGISIASRLEWRATCNYFDKTTSECDKYPFGEFFFIKVKDEDVIIYYSGSGKAQASAACQYMIDKFRLDKVIVIGTCAGIDDNYKALDIIVPNRAVQCDCTVKEQQPLIKERFSVNIDLSDYQFKYNTGMIGTSDKPVVIMKDYLDLKNNNIAIADMEASAIAYICKCNGVKVIIIKGISDFPLSNNDSKKSYEEQVQMYETNTKFIMNEVFDNYLEKFI